MKKILIETFMFVKTTLVTTFVSLRWAFRVAAALLIITQTAVPIYLEWLNLAAERMDAADYILGDLAALFTIFTYVIGYGVWFLIITAFKTAGEHSDKEAAKRAEKKAQAQMQTSSQAVPEA